MNKQLLFLFSCRLPLRYLKNFRLSRLFGLDFGLSEGGPLLSDAGGVSSKAAAASLFCWVED